MKITCKQINDSLLNKFIIQYFDIQDVLFSLPNYNNMILFFRFIAGHSNQNKDGGFKLAWSAVRTAEDGNIDLFLL